MSAFKACANLVLSTCPRAPSPSAWVFMNGCSRAGRLGQRPTHANASSQRLTLCSIVRVLTYLTYLCVLCSRIVHRDGRAREMPGRPGQVRVCTHARVFDVHPGLRREPKVRSSAAPHSACAVRREGQRMAVRLSRLCWRAHSRRQALPRGLPVHGDAYVRPWSPTRLQVQDALRRHRAPLRRLRR